MRVVFSSRSILRVAGAFAAALLMAAGARAQTVNLNAGPTQTVLPDGQTVPMWGYSCGSVDAAAAAGATCLAANPQAGTKWSPVVITVPYNAAGTSLTVNLTNSLSFTTPGGKTNSVPTSLLIVGQLGGGLGSSATSAPSPAHAPQGTTWPVVGDTNGSAFTPPAQGARVRSLAAEVAAGTTQALCWGPACSTPTPPLKPGTYLINSATHPSIQVPMGLYGVLVVTNPAAPDGSSPGTAYPHVSYAAELALVLGEIDPIQNSAVDATVRADGFNESAIRLLRDHVNSVAVSTDPATGNPLGGSGYKAGDPVAFTGGGAPFQAAAAHVDSVDGSGAILTVVVDTPGAGYAATPTVSVNSSTGNGAQLTAGLAITAGTPCSDGAAACYPPAVNYAPRYYLMNGVSFDRTTLGGAASPSVFTTSPAHATGAMLVRLVNAGLRMHVPSIVGAQTKDSSNSIVNGMVLIAEDGNPLPGNPRVQSEVFLAAGKTYDVLINTPALNAPALPVFDRQLSLSTNGQRDGGMQAFISVNGATVGNGIGTSAPGPSTTFGNLTFYCVAAAPLAVTDPGRGVLGGVSGVNGATLGTVSLANAADTLSFNPDGTFTYIPDSKASQCGGSFQFLVNGSLAKTASIVQCDASTAGSSACRGVLGAAPVANADAYSSMVATFFKAAPPGVLTNDADPSGLALTAANATGISGGQVTLNADGSFTATPNAGSTQVTFQYTAVNAQKTPSSAPATVTVSFAAPRGLAVTLKDAKNGVAITDYRWIIEEDRTFWVDPKCQGQRPVGQTTLDSFGKPCPPMPGPSLGVNFHTSHMPLVAQGCTGPISCESGQTVLGQPAVCDIGNGQCRTDGSVKTAVDPSQVVLDPNKRYYISVAPADGINPTLNGAGGPQPVDPNKPGGATRPFDIAKDCGPFNPGAGSRWEPGGANALCGHAMGGAQIVAGQTSVAISLQETPLPVAKIAVIVFEDDNPLNGEIDAGGGIDILAPNEPGLGDFNLTLFDQAGQFGDSTGQLTYDMFNQPVSNALAGMADPVTGYNACGISPNSTDGKIGMVPVCPKYELNGTALALDASGNPVLSPLAGQAIIDNLYPGLYEVLALPGATRTARGEQWLQTSTLDGTKPQEAFIKAGEPAYFQEFGPAGYHVMIGMANPAIIRNRKLNAAHNGICDPLPGGGGLSCPASINGQVTNLHFSRTPDQRVYSTGDGAHYAFTSCYVSLGPPDGPDFDFAFCDQDGKFHFDHVPLGNYRVTVFDQWNDIMVDGLSTPIVVGGSTQCTSGNSPVCTYEIPVTQWRQNLYTRTFLDTNGDGVSNHDTTGVPCTAPGTPQGCNPNYGADTEPGLPLVPTNIRYRDGSYGYFNNTDLNGYAAWNEVFPILNWLVVEADDTRYKPTGTHVVVDTGGPVDGSKYCNPAAAPCGNSTIAASLANTYESPTAHVPQPLRFPGARYCASADCPAGDPGFNPDPAVAAPGSSGRVDPPWAPTEAWEGLLGQNSFLEFGKKPFVAGENGGIHGHVVYASTRPFDDPQLLLQLSWEPAVPNVTMNLYQEGTAADGSRTLTLVDTTLTSSWDDWAQGFRRNADGTLAKDASGRYIPNMSCPGVEKSSLFYFTLQNSEQYLNPGMPLAEDARFKCFDGWAALNQLVPAPYDGRYQFPSIGVKDPSTGQFILQFDPGLAHYDSTLKKWTSGTNCTICTVNPDDGTPMLPAGKYVVEVIVPPGYELVKEEDKNILLGDVFIAPVTQQFPGFGNVFILPDQAALNASYNPNNPVNATANLGSKTFPRHEGDTGSVEAYWPCAGATRVVPDYMSLYPGSKQTAPFAGASRPLCDRKEVVIEDQSSVLAKFYIFSSAHIAAHFTGVITNDYASEFDPFSPAFGEKFAVPNVPVALKDFNGNEMSRVLADQWGTYNGLTYSTWDVNPPNPTGYAPQVMIACMNDPGPVRDADPNSPTFGQMIQDPLYNRAYSDFCYEWTFMPGQTAYMDTPVLPVMSFADNYNLPDCEYPDNTPSIKAVIGDSINGGDGGPWVAGADNTAQVTSVKVNSGGSYTSLPAVSFTGGGGDGGSAVATAKVTAFNVASNGSGYVSVPNVTVSPAGSGGTSASASAVMELDAVVVSNSGSGYTSQNAHVCFSGGGGSGATATATVQGGRVTRINISNRGLNYTAPPAVSVATNASCTAFPSNTATGTATLRVNSLHLVAGGSGYSATPVVTIAPPPPGSGRTTARAGVTLTVDAVIVTSGGEYVSAPAVHFSSGSATAAASIGPLTSHKLTITALGDKQVPNHAYSGPGATAAPFNQKWTSRHYGFGATAGSVGLLDASGVLHPLTNVQWSDTTITGGVPTGVPACPLQQQGVSGARCGELMIITANQVKSIDTVTVTVGGKTPTYVKQDSPSTNLFGSTRPNPLQSAIDNATPGDLIIVAPGTYQEQLIMWKPVRLQGVGANSVTIDANAHPAGLMLPWRRQMDCVFGLSLNGRPLLSDGTYPADTFDATGTYACPASMQQRVDRINMEAIVGWDTAGNGNLAELLQEPTLMGAYEGAAITVIGRGVRIPAGSTDFWGASNAGAFPTGWQYLTNVATDCTASTTRTDGLDYGTANFLCNPSRIDGLSITNSSQGGGGILVHAWGHNLEIANNHIAANQGTMSGGITVGNGEFPDAIVNGGDVAPPFPVPPGTPANMQLGYGLNVNVNIHHNSVTANASIGDALYSFTPTGAGGVTFCSGADNYKFNYNWVCGNLSTGDGGGVVHAGFINDAQITHNSIMFNQTVNTTLTTNGGGIGILGASPDRTLPNGQECGNTAADADCPPGLAEGTGRNLLIDSNLIIGNSAEAGSGGGVRLQLVNGIDVQTFPANPENWNSITMTNNIIANNVAGWDGGGISLQDALKVRIVNNTVVSNDTTASAGVLFNTLAAPLSAVPPPGCTPQPDPSLPQDPSCINPVKTSTPQAAGLVTMANSPNLTAALPLSGTQGRPGVVCPSGYGYGSGNSLRDGACRSVSLPLLLNNLFWQNRAFYIDVGGFGAASQFQNQQQLVSLVPGLNQTFTGMCAGAGVDASGREHPVNFWDIGVRGDTGPANHASGFTLASTSSIYTGGGDPAFIRQYCNGSRIPPENTNGFVNGKAAAYNAPAGRSETTGLYPVFMLNQITPAATVDEGNNWINLGWGPLALINPMDGTTVLGNYSIGAGSSAINAGSNNGAPATDFFGHTRALTTRDPADVGAVEYTVATGAEASVTPVLLNFGNAGAGSSSVMPLTVRNDGSAALSGIAVAFGKGSSSPFSRPSANPGTCTAGNLASGTTCTINVVVSVPANATANSVVSDTAAVTVTTPGGTAVNGSPVSLSVTVVAPPIVTVKGGPLNFGNVVVGTIGAPQTLTVTNTGGSTFTGLTLAFSNPQFSRPSGAAGGTCGSSLDPGDGVTTGACTINVVFTPTVVGTVNGSATISGNAAAIGSPVTVGGTGTAPNQPHPAVLDGFNRANANTLGSSWDQIVLFGLAAIHVNANQALDPNLAGAAYWDNQYGTSQAAAFTFAAAPASGYALVLKATGGAASAPASYVRVRYTGSSVVVETTTNGIAFTSQATFNGTFAIGDTLTAMVDATGGAYVWKTTAANASSFLGGIAIPAASFPGASGSGRIGMQLPVNGRVDNFAGGNGP